MSVLRESLAKKAGKSGSTCPPKLYALVMIMVAVIMPPGPVVFLLIRRDVAEIAVFVIVVFPRPLVIIDDLIPIPDVVVVIVGVVYTVIVMSAGDAESRTRQRRREKP
jgi:hypothetical protein